MTVPVEVARLIQTFERNIESYRQGRYNRIQGTQRITVLNSEHLSGP